MTEKETVEVSSSMSENAKKLNLENPSKRQEYLNLIDRLLETAFTKAQSHYCKNRERIGWIRAITGLVNAGVFVLRDRDIEEIIVRLERLEKEVGNK